MRRAQLARQLDPLTMATRADLCWLLNYAGRFEEAVTACTNALNLTPGHLWTTLGKVEALRHLGRAKEALTSFSSVAPEGSQGPVASTWMAQQDPAVGLNDAWSWLRSVVSEGRQPLAAASLAAILGEQERAMRLLEVSWDSRSMLIAFLAVDPRFERLRGTPRFESLLSRIGLRS